MTAGTWFLKRKRLLGTFVRGVRMEAETTRALSRAARGTGPIVVGPWLSEVGFEVLYWVPYLRWCVERFEIDPARVVVVSRGGTALWYQGCADRYVEIFDLLSPAEFKARNEERIRASGLQKQIAITSFDRELLAKGGLDPDGHWLHPSAMYRLFAGFWLHLQSIKVVERHAVHAPQRRPPRPDGLPDGDYVAVKFYFNDSFPDTAANREFVDGIVRQLARRLPVVLLHTGLSLDDHPESPIIGSGVFEVTNRMTARDNLDFQTRVLANAKAFYGTYGGFSYLTPYYGVPSHAFYSAEEKFADAHLEVARAAVRHLAEELDAGAFPGYVASFTATDRSPFESAQQTLEPS